MSFEDFLIIRNLIAFFLVNYAKICQKKCFYFNYCYIMPYNAKELCRFIA